LQDTVSPTKSKREWHTPRLIEVFYPLKIGSTQDRHNWIAAMMLDARLSDRDKTILARLALHLNLKTGRCDPTVDLLALETSMPGKEETARRMVRRSLERADKVGWIERTGRHSGSRLNRSNSYRLTIPKDVRPDKFDRSPGQIERVDRTPESGRIGKVNREREYSVPSVQPLARKDRTSDGRSALSYRESTSYTAEQVERVRQMMEDYNLRTIGSLVAADPDLTGAIIGAMCRDGFFARAGDKIMLLSTTLA
jgi:hypothetical protein